jgi:hypothetical protein
MDFNRPAGIHTSILQSLYSTSDLHPTTTNWCTYFASHVPHLRTTIFVDDDVSYCTNTNCIGMFYQHHFWNHSVLQIATSNYTSLGFMNFALSFLFKHVISFKSSNIWFFGCSSSFHHLESSYLVVYHT